MTDKDIRKAHKMAVAAHKKLKEAEDFLVTYEKNPFWMTVYPSINITTSNIFKVQDAIGGKLRQEPFLLHKNVFDVMLEVDGVRYIQSGLTQEDINARQSNLDYEIGSP